MTILYRMLRADRASPREPVAQVVVLDSGKCVVSWPTSVIVYDSEDAARAVHIQHMGGRGSTTSFAPEWSDIQEFMRGVGDCVQDDMENAHFASVGGLNARHSLTPPSYSKNHEGYLRGYVAQAANAYGEDWQDCSFSWGPALTIGGDDPKAAEVGA